MNKEAPCRNCNGTGKETITLCDICKKEVKLGEYEGKMICQDCWAETLTDEEIMNL